MDQKSESGERALAFNSGRKTMCLRQGDAFQGGTEYELAWREVVGGAGNGVESPPLGDEIWDDSRLRGIYDDGVSQTTRCDFLKGAVELEFISEPEI